MARPISHALVLPDENFMAWLDAVRPYMNAFERVAVVRSPAGNDLNRFRSVTAVEAPRTWFEDDALKHIQRAYPSVVRVDVIKVNTPAKLAQILEARIQARDRFGEQNRSTGHIFDRFTLEWPVEARPTRIVRDFSVPADRDPDTHEGVDLQTYPGTAVNAAAPGEVTRVVSGNDALNYSAYVQVTTSLAGQTYITTYAGLQDIRVGMGQRVSVGDRLGYAAGDRVKLVVQNPPHGMSGFALPHVVDPMRMIYWQGLRLRPTVRVLRVRSLPGAHGDILGTVGPSNALETEEMHGPTLAKIGVEGEWVRVRYPGQRQAYTAAAYLEPFGEDDPVEVVPGTAVPGINIDLDHPHGRPDPNTISRLGWVRLRYNVSLNPNVPEGHPNRHGNTDINATFQRYRPLLNAYQRAGLKIILILTHQTFGEGQGYVWHQMNSARWRDLTRKYVDVVRRVAEQFARTDLIYAYQIWNEQDSSNYRAAVPMPVEDYAYLLGESIRAIRGADSRAKIITGGHVSGPGTGAAYATETLKRLPRGIEPDGIAFHPYGRGASGHRFSQHGSISESLTVWTRIMPGRPVWITEWGVLDQQGNHQLADEVADYADGFIKALGSFPGQVACATWYAWADGMDNGYGLVRADGQPREPLYSRYLR
jgi:murein DD-endopeptidase MepM/ murein hydrolase activator NlpD